MCHVNDYRVDPEDIGNTWRGSFGEFRKNFKPA